MPILRNPRHEAFCQAFARGECAGNGTAAYASIFGCTLPAASANASKLLKKTNISERLSEIRTEIANMDAKALAQATEKLGITKEWVLEKLVENLAKGMKREDGSTVNKAAELLGKHLGMFIPTTEQNVNLNLGVEVVDRPPRETFEQWKERRQLELKAVPVKAINGNGKAH